jgi:hypothetical protein
LSDLEPGRCAREAQFEKVHLKDSASADMVVGDPVDSENQHRLYILRFFKLDWTFRDARSTVFDKWHFLGPLLEVLSLL